MTTYATLYDLLKSRDKAGLLSIISSGISLPPMFKVMALTAINTMTDEQIQKICDKGIEALGFMEHDDWTGLQEFMDANNVPAPFVEVIKAYAAHQLSEQ